MRLLPIVIALASTTASAGPLPAGFEEVPGAQSPARTYTVIWPDVDHVIDGVKQNCIVATATGKCVATIDTETVFAHESHATPAPMWTRDGKTLVWYVDGKWGSRELTVIWIDGGKVTRQVDVREQVVGVVLRAVERAAPRAYAIAKQEGQGSGSWYRDGLSIEVRPASKTAAFPLALVIDLTSDPKCLDSYPKAGRIGYRATARVDATGKVTVGPLQRRASCGM